MANEGLYTNNLGEFVIRMFRAMQANLHTITVAKIETVHDKTIDVQPVINRTLADGTSVPLPVLPNIMPLFLGGGNSYTAYPLERGDYCLVLFNERCIDNWHDGQDFVSPPVGRMHNYSDGFALCGLKTAEQLANIPTETTHIGTVRMGTADPSDYMALASLVESQLNAIRSAFNSHIHTAPMGATGTPAVPVTPVGGVPQPPREQGAPAVGSVRSAYVKAD